MTDTSTTRVPRACLFCGDEKKLTKEHIWPRWLLLHIRSRDAFPGGTFTPTINGMVGVERPIMDVTVRCLCAPCNNVWLSGVEEVVKPIVCSLMDGEDVVLDAVGQRQLAFWLTKFHMLLAQVDSTFSTIIPTEHVRHMRRTDSPPLTYKVWIGRIVADGPPKFSSEHHNMSCQRPIGSGLIRGYVHLTTLRFHQFVAQVYGFSDLDGEEHHLKHGLGGDAYSRQIWPITQDHCEWPPPYSFNEATFEAVKKMQVQRL